jgi:hypothetical protein
MKPLRIRLLLLVVLAALFSAGCAGEVGPSQTTIINVPKPGDPSQVWDVELNLGAASVRVDAEGTGLVSGLIEYNVEALAPKVTVTPRRVVIGQDFTGVLPLNTRNDWQLKLGRGVPMTLTVNTGASSGEWELGGLSLRHLGWTQGAAGATLAFSQPNPETMEHLRINGGAASLTARGLANTNARTANVTAGAGAMSLYFDGSLREDMNVLLDGGVSSIAIYSGGNPIEIKFESALKAIDNRGWAQIDDETYRSPEWVEGGAPKITIRARLGVAALTLVAGQ